MDDREHLHSEPPPPAGAEGDRRDESLLSAAPGLARIAAAAWWNTAEWTLGASARAGARVMRAAASGESAGDFLQSASADVRDYARRMLGVLDAREPSAADEVAMRDDPEGDGDAPPPRELRARGAELLRRSADVRYDEPFHQAYVRILEVLAPDEARILRLLATRGPQPSVDVRSGLPLASELVAPGLTMIGAEAGCRHLDRVQAYLNNLYRLGLIWFSREQVKDPLRYQVLEAQPDVVEAMRRSGRTGRTVRRSIHLTPFGEDFCETCLPL